MCGLAGIYAPGGLDRDAGEQLRRMTDTLRHRGPDDEGWWVDAEAGIALGFRRLAIIDLSPAGPPADVLGRRPLRRSPSTARSTTSPTCGASWRRRASAFRGHSDTEVLLEAIARWGVEPALARCVGHVRVRAVGPGRARRCTWCATGSARSRSTTAGMGGTLPVRVGAEGAARAPALARRDRPRRAGAATCGTATSRRRTRSTADIASCRPATILTVRAGRSRSRPDGRTGSAARWPRPGMRGPASRTPAEAVVGRARGAAAATPSAREMVADVPLGAFLSGGIDSSTVVALMQAQSTRPVRTFTIGFRGGEYDEAAHARAVAGHLGTDHTELYVTPGRGAGGRSRELPAIYDEPFADSSQIPTLLVSRLARRHVTVEPLGRRRRRAVRRLQPLLTGAAGSGASWRAFRDRSARRPRAWCTASRRAAWNARRAWALRCCRRGSIRRSFGAKLHKVGDLLERAGRATTSTSGRCRSGPTTTGWSSARRPPRDGGSPTAARWPRFGDRSRGRCTSTSDLPARRHPGEGGPGEHGGEPRGAGAAAGPRGRRVRLAGADGAEGRGRTGEGAAPPGARAARAAGADGAAEDGVRRAAGRLAARAAARMGGGAARAGAACGRTALLDPAEVRADVVRGTCTGRRTCSTRSGRCSCFRRGGADEEAGAGFACCERVECASPSSRRWCLYRIVTRRFGPGETDAFFLAFGALNVVIAPLYNAIGSTLVPRIVRRRNERVDELPALLVPPCLGWPSAVSSPRFSSRSLQETGFG